MLYLQRHSKISQRKVSRIFVLLSITGALEPALSHQMGSKSSAPSSNYPIYGADTLMAPKAHGSCSGPTMQALRWSVDRATADNICCFNRHFAEHSQYFIETNFLQEVKYTTLTIYSSHYYCALFFIIFIV